MGMRFVTRLMTGYAALCIVALASPVFASTLFSQLDDSTQVSVNGLNVPPMVNASGEVWAKLVDSGTSLESITIAGVQWKLNLTIGGGWAGSMPKYTGFQYDTYTSTDCSTGESGYQAVTNVLIQNDGAFHTYTMDFGSPVTTGSNVHCIQFSPYNLPTDSRYDDSAYLGNLTGGTTHAYYEVYGPGGPTPSYPSQSATSSVSNFSSPTAFQTTGGTTVTFSFVYGNYSLFGKSGVELNDVTIGAGMNVDVPEHNITMTGTSTYSQNVVLISGHSYSATPYIRDTVTGEHLYGDTVFFGVVSAFNQFNSSVPAVNGVTEANASSTVEAGFFDFLNVPKLLVTKFPFSFIFGLALNYESITASSTAAFPVVALDYGHLVGISTSTRDALPSLVVLFSTTTVSTYLSDGIRGVFRALAAASIWLSFAYVLYRRLTSSLDNEA